MKKNRLIVAFIMIVIFAVLNGFSLQPKITGIKIQTGSAQTEIFLEMDKIVDPIIEMEADNAALRFDFPGLTMSRSITERVFSGPQLRLGYIFAHKGEMKVTGMRLFPEDAMLKSVRRWRQGVVINLSKRSSAEKKTGRNSEGLLDPDEDRFAPVSISLKDSPAMPIIQGLADRGEIDIRFSGQIPENLTIDLDAANPLEALKTIATEIGGKMEQRQKTWWFLGGKA